MTKIYSEMIGTTILIFLGNGVVANVLLSKTKGNDKKRGWLVITIGWALAVFMGGLVSSPYSGGHLNPCVTLSFAIIGKISWKLVPFYIFSQLLGSMLGSIMVWLLYKDHFYETENQQDKLSVFATVPSIKNRFSNFMSEVLSTFIFIFIFLYFTSNESFIRGREMIGFAPSMIVLGIILSLGGSTGPAINPVRDLGPRIIYSILPIPGKGDSNWGYSFIPILGPIVGGTLATMLYVFLSL